MDRQLLAAAIGLAYESRRGQRKRVAASVGLADDALRRLESGQQRNVSVDTLERLYRLVAGEDHALIDAAVIPERAFTMVDAARAHYARKLSELLRQTAIPPMGRAKKGKRPGFVPKLFFERVSELNIVVALARKLPGDAAAFEKLCESGHHSHWRIKLAWFRIVAPLVDYQETGYIERAWWELTKKEFRAFIDSGLRRERILLRRSYDELRAIEAVTDDLPAQVGDLHRNKVPTTEEAKVKFLFERHTDIEDSFSRLTLGMLAQILLGPLGSADPALRHRMRTNAPELESRVRRLTGSAS